MRESFTKCPVCDKEGNPIFRGLPPNEKPTGKFACNSSACRVVQFRKKRKLNKKE